MSGTSWRAEAKCQGVISEWWTPQHVAGRVPAREMTYQVLLLIEEHCHRCVVRTECWVDAVASDEGGVRGGRLRMPTTNPDSPRRWVEIEERELREQAGAPARRAS